MHNIKDYDIIDHGIIDHDINDLDHGISDTPCSDMGSSTQLLSVPLPPVASLESRSSIMIIMMVAMMMMTMIMVMIMVMRDQPATYLLNLVAQVPEEKQQQAMALVIMSTVGLEKEKYRLGHTKVG